VKASSYPGVLLEASFSDASTQAARYQCRIITDKMFQGFSLSHGVIIFLSNLQHDLKYSV